jgi:hypothetical protein
MQTYPDHYIIRKLTPTNQRQDEFTHGGRLWDRIKDGMTIAEAKQIPADPTLYAPRNKTCKGFTGFNWRHIHHDVARGVLDVVDPAKSA